MKHVTRLENFYKPIFIALGANISSERWGAPQHALETAIRLLGLRKIITLRQSRWFESAPVPASDQPWFVNGVIEVETQIPPADLLATLHSLEAEFGRVRTVRNAARVLDLDLIAYGSQVIEDGETLMVPHPRLAQRAFVLLPLADIAPDWCHPSTGQTVGHMIAALPAADLDPSAIRPLQA